MNFLKSVNTLIFTTIFIVFFALSSKSQNSPAKYSNFDRGSYYFYYGKKDSAFLMYSMYVNNPDDTLKKGMAYRYMGDIQWAMGDLHGAQESATGVLQTLDTLDEKHYMELGYTFNLLGDVSLNMKRYDEAIDMYNKAIRFFKGSDFMLEVMNGKATAFQKKGEYKAAIAVYDSILSLKPANQKLVARIIDNKARTKWLLDPAYPVLPEFWSALKIRVDSQYKAGLNASYAHLSDYYVNLKPDSALWYAQKMFEQAKENQSPDDILEAIDKLIRLNGSPLVKEHWYNEFKKLNDSLQLSRDTTRNRFALIRYDVQKSKADNLVLQQHITKQRLLTYGVIVLAAVIIIWLSLWYSKRRKRIKQESENAIRNSKLKTSQKVHDVVANGLYGIMNELEHSKAIDREPLINKIEVLYEKSRNISYEDIGSGKSIDYDNQVHQLLTSFANDQTKVIVVGNQPTYWNRISASQKHELQLVLNELMINMKKHSHAKNVVIVFKQEDNKGFINYKDDGVGFDSGSEFGNGLNNTVSRIKSLNGDVNFGKSEKAGVFIAISFPLESSKTL